MYPPTYAGSPQYDEQPVPQRSSAERRGVRTHDGFYFRFAIGAGVLSGTASDDSETELDTTGTAILTEIAFGGSPAPGVVIGGGSYDANIPGTTYTFDGEDFEEESSSLGVVGPFVDIYPDPHSGFHLQGALGFSYITAGEGDLVVPDDYAGFGFGLMAGLGYEGWVSDEWSMGVIARILYGSATASSVSGDYDDVDFGGVVPGALFGITYH